MTPASSRPLRRRVDGGRLGQLVIEVRFDTITVRPFRCRRALVVVKYDGLVYGLLQPPRGRRRGAR